MPNTAAGPFVRKVMFQQPPKIKEQKKLEFTEKGFEVRSPCGRIWFVPFEAARDVLAEDIVHEDKVSMEEAKLRADKEPEMIVTWFNEQFNYWEDIEKYGKLVKKASAAEIKAALDFYRDNSSQHPTGDVVKHNLGTL